MALVRAGIRAIFLLAVLESDVILGSLSVLYGSPPAGVAVAVRDVEKTMSARDGRNLPLGLPLVVNTWSWTGPTEKAWSVLTDPKRNASVVDAVVEGCSVAEHDLMIDSVGYGNHPDESGETTLDAMVIDGTTMSIGAVADLRRVKNAIGVARAVMMHTQHTMLVGEAATSFAVSMGFQESTLSTDHSRKIHDKWLNGKCQPNFWRNVMPDPTTHCGPYAPITNASLLDPAQKPSRAVNEHNHDTIGMIAIDADGHIAAGTSTNGAQFKIPGRVGDTAINGAGAFVDPEIGAAAATGDGDVMMRFLPSMVAVELLRQGATPYNAGVQALRRIAKVHPTVKAAVVVAKKNGEFAGACYGFEDFQFSVVDILTGMPQVFPVPCFTLTEDGQVEGRSAESAVVADVESPMV